MPHEITLITTVVAALSCGLIFGLIAVRLKLPALVGYLAAGILIGTATPGFVADVALAGQLAEIDVLPLMVGVGLHFSLNDLLDVRRIALPGAIFQIAVATAWFLARRYRLPVPWCYCVPWKIREFWIPSTAALRLAGW